MEERLMKNVRQYPCLWDTKLPSYKDLEVKDAAWKAIIKKANIDTVKNAKTKWKSLRDTHREKLKKIIETTSGQERKCVKPWKYMQLMEFLVPHMFNRERDVNITSSPSQDEQMTDHSDTMDAQDENKGDARCKAHDKNEGDFGCKNTAKRSRNNDDDLNQVLKNIEEYHAERSLQRKELRRELPRPVDSLKSFFDSMYESTKKMPDCYQRSIKRKLFNAVMEAEEDFANFSQQGYYTSQYNNNTNAVSIVSESSGPTYTPSPAGATSEQLSTSAGPNDPSE